MAITINDIKKLSPKAKVLVVCLFFFIIGYLYWFYFLSSAIEKKNSLNEKLTAMQEQIKEKTKVAEQINKYMAEVTTLKENYKIALQKLPDQKEIPGLLHSVALAGRDAGIDFLIFEPKATVPKMLEKLSPEPKAAEAPRNAAAVGKNPPPAAEPFYEEIPVAVSIMGTFQNILYFFDKVAKLPRIVNVSDIYMGDRKDVKGKGQVMASSCIIKTYMFIDKKEKTSEKVSEKTK
ncbi:MAG: type 4a pilus biogenesis protein PilO [Deltaproteobacteria bacterium]|nr:type 4a pilus biogenesis protein PilO [Deltaproteobacteria bacterium]